MALATAKDALAVQQPKLEHGLPRAKRRVRSWSRGRQMRGSKGDSDGHQDGERRGRVDADAVDGSLSERLVHFVVVVVVVVVVVGVGVGVVVNVVVVVVAAGQVGGSGSSSKGTA